MHKLIAVTLTLSGLLVTTTYGAQAEKSAGASPKGSNQNSAAPKQEHKGLLSKDLVLSVQSLTNDQKQKIEGVFQALEQDLQPIMDKMKPIKDQLHAARLAEKSAGGKPGAGDQSKLDSIRTQLQPFKEQIRAKRGAAKDKLEALLNQSQLSELDQLRDAEIAKHKKGSGKQNSTAADEDDKS